MTPDVSDISALVLAGERAGPNALLASEGASSKAEILINDRPMMDYVLEALSNSGVSGPFHIAGAHDVTRARLDAGEPAGRINHLPASPGPAAAVLAALSVIDRYPVLITTSDHPLLTPDMIRHFVSASLSSEADLAVGLATSDTIEEAYPRASRTYFPVGGRKVSGCNLFMATSPEALKAVRFWMQAETDRKRPARIAARFGLLNALRILRPGVSFDGVFRILSKRLGCVVRPVMMPVAEAAIDVDKPEDLALVREVLSGEVA